MTIFNQKLRSCHWLVRGKHFFELHEIFEEMYNEWAAYIDDIAERVLTIKGLPLSTLQKMLDVSSIEEPSSYDSAEEMMDVITADLEYFVESLAQIISEAEKIGDRGTTNLLDNIHDAQQKRIWMFQAWSDKLAVTTH